MSESIGVHVQTTQTQKTETKAVKTRKPRRCMAPVTSEGPILSAIFIFIAVGFLTLFLILPLVTVFYEAFRSGLSY
jgi:sulfate/thiosulfate transport system permease protein